MELMTLESSVWPQLEQRHEEKNVNRHYMRPRIYCAPYSAQIPRFTLCSSFLRTKRKPQQTEKFNFNIKIYYSALTLVAVVVAVCFCSFVYNAEIFVFRYSTLFQHFELLNNISRCLSFLWVYNTCTYMKM